MLHLTRAKNKNESHTLRMMSKLVGISQRLKNFCFFNNLLRGNRLVKTTNKVLMKTCKKNFFLFFETKSSVTKAEP